MFQSIENLVDCEIRFLIRFLNSKDVKTAEIHRQISEVYGENSMREGVNDLEHFKMAARVCMKRNEVGDLLSLLKTWRRKLRGKLERTNPLRFHLHLMSFLKFQEAFFVEL
ncbi:hypothetical protein AVEN_117029-1 [Araneus ventricosus]|uniref:Mos1 transposase HTH domain-containing protein n=1 Tax=Araneus ventricosus TaxID=182803 RepID=A0A4Y2P972_ARAVE|nr:hypothetical protein AVEN_117029-1 [Araneus ventricosus]